MFLPIWPKPQKYFFKTNKNKVNKKVVEKIENFFSKNYNSKYCALMPSARSGIVLSFIYKKFNRSKIIRIPRWSSNCLYTSLGSISDLTCSNYKFNATLVVHTLGRSQYTKSKSILVDDSSDSLPTNNFTPYINSKFSDVISLPKIIGSYCGGIVLTNNKLFYKFLKSYQMKNITLASEQSFKKYKCNVVKKGNFEWFYNESFNFSLDYNSCENIYQNLDNFYINKETILKRLQTIKYNEKKRDKYRIGPCLIFNYNNISSKFFETRHVNASKFIDNENYLKKLIFPIHLSITDSEFNKRIDDIKKNKLF